MKRTSVLRVRMAAVVYDRASLERDTAVILAPRASHPGVGRDGGRRITRVGGR